MAERRWALHPAVFLWVLTVVGLSDVRARSFVLASAGGRAFLQQTSAFPGEASILHELRISLQLGDEVWPGASDPCSAWVGVLCENGHVVEISLSSLSRASASTALPASIDAIQHLPYLRSLNASGVFRLGSLPVWIGGMVSLEVVDFMSSSLSGSIPSSFGEIPNLRILRLADNNLTGSIPSTLGNLAKLKVLDLASNNLHGSIPESLGNLRELQELNLSFNRLQGSIPVELSGLLSLQRLLLSHNLLYGPLPPQLALPSSLSLLDLSANYLTGAPPRIEQPNARAHYRDNCFSPPLSSGQRSVSDCRSMLKARGFNRQRILQDLLQFPPNNTSSNDSHLAAILGGVFGGLGLILLVAVLVFYIIQHERKTEARRRAKRAAQQRATSGINGIKPLGGRSINVTRLGEAFTYSQLQQSTGQFDLSNMIMAGHTGDLYKGVINGNVHVVVKRIDVSRFKKDMYISELEFFGRVSHARLVPLLGHCLDRDEEKLLVYKYMPNGDLAYALHRKDSPSRPEEVLQSLDWITRLKIAIGAAEGLVYLHHECSPPLVHRDVKASSILLDDKFEVRLGSLTDARVQQGEHHSGVISRFLRLSRSSEQSDIGSSGSPIASCSYDVFCFGKVLLELVSGKLGISGSIDPGADAWLDWALPLIDIHDREPLSKLMDPSLIVDEDLMEEVWATAIIAKSCLNPKSSRRPNMKHILKALENPQKVVRDDHSGPLKSRHSSYGSWNSALFGGWRHCSSESVFGFPGSLREEHSFEQHPRMPPSGPGEDSRQHRRPGSREIFPVPVALPLPPNQESDDTGS
ncbi:hypothetical protein MPTK1_8g15760 [Marchantia polymorpha subsp. ruderalis]|uniref:Protein kinase domain-containing protein n=1 Tax=Marchantia polymorpha TaxID=3197 RepID=A0A2R6WKY7_MARPO|nr:hypothetical protein MARPO_0079s0036 [Marchantia polymorpha]BBN20025.1 hypothetical protein Mp_8g15760 [Marchantia polymorpha subsp. ruderalis]|eukprot:PTQ34527.1 hypothetical protein MARPO_0079s0036 [Marchantia polymorpha]